MPCGCTNNNTNNKDLGDKIIRLEDMKNMSIDEIVNIYRKGYRLEDYGKLSDKQPILLLSPKISGLSPANCPTGNVIQETTKSITITVPGGVPNYTFHFKRDTTEIYTSPSQSSTTHTFNYTFSQTNGDTTGTHTYSAIVTDSCSAGSQTSGTDSCTITIQAPSTLGNVRFHTSPGGADIWVGTTKLGTTDTSGVLLVNGLTANPSLNFDVKLTGYNPGSGTVAVVAGTTVDAPLITLTQIQPATGSIRFHTIPVGAHIWIAGVDRGTTDSSGALLISGLAIGSLSYIVKYTGYVDSPTQTVTVVQDTITDAPLVTLSPKTGSARFHTTPGGADIWAGTLKLGTTDSTGVVVVQNLAIGAYYFIVRKSGYVDSPVQNVTVVENVITDAPAVTLTQSTGSVRFHTSPGTADIWVGTTILGTTDATGVLLIQNIPTNPSYTFIVKKTGYTDSPTQTISIIENTIVDAPLVTLVLISTGKGSVIFTTNPGGADIWAGTTKLGTTSAGTTGTVRVDNLNVGSLSFIVKKTGYTDSPTQTVTVVDSTVINAATVTLSPISTGKGSVIFTTNPGGADIWAGTTKLGTTSAGTTGTVRVDNLNVGSLSFIVKKTGYTDSPTQTVTVVDSTTVNTPTVTLTQNMGTVRFHVTCDSTPCSDAHITIQGQDRGATLSGTLTVSGLTAGTGAVFNVTKTGYNPGSQMVDIVAGTTTDAPTVNITPIVTGTGTVRFHVTCGGTPCSGAYIVIGGIDRGVTISDGTSTVSGLSPGTGVAFSVTKTGYTSGSQTVDIVADTTVDAPTVNITQAQVQAGGGTIILAVAAIGIAVLAIKMKKPKLPGS